MVLISRIDGCWMCVRWEDQAQDEGVKWHTLEHKGPIFAPPYERLPKDVKFYYNGQVMRLSQDAEEVAGFYGKMLEHEYTTRDLFNNNFMKDWRKVSRRRTIEIKPNTCPFLTKTLP